MANKKSLFLISNGSNEIYKSNTLTNFKNKLPEPLDFIGDDKYEIAVESVGFSCIFRNIKLPDDDSFPSFIITNQLTPDDVHEGQCVYEGQDNEICTKPMPFTIRTEPYVQPGDRDDKQYFYYFGRFSEKYYSQEELTNYFEIINSKCPVYIKFIGGLLNFGRNPQNHEHGFYHVLIHPSMMETFGFESTVILEYRYAFMSKNGLKDFDPADRIVNNVWKKNVYKKVMHYDGQIYYVFTIGALTEKVRATKSPVDKKTIFPNVVKVQSDNISPQIFNNSFSNDLVVFCPDFSINNDYHFHEFESKQYVPLLNSTITDFEIKICDENNKQLQLLPGVPSILKIDIRKMSKKTNFNVRLTSTPNKEFPNNKNHHFRVKLPSVISLDNNWRVALTSITHPNSFKTLLASKNSRGMQIRYLVGPPPIEGLVISSNDQDIKNKVLSRGQPNVRIHTRVFEDIMHTETSLQKELIEFFSSTGNNFGEVVVNSNSIISLKFWQKSVFIVSNNLLRVLGYNEELNLNDNATAIVIDDTNSNLIIGKNGDGTENFTLVLNKPINLDALRPNYMIAYTNFIESSIIGGIYSKILRVIPVSNADKGYIISDFKHKEFLELQNTEISEIEIVLRSHDGEYVNFGTKEDIILNLEFTNDVIG